VKRLLVTALLLLAGCSNAPGTGPAAGDASPRPEPTTHVVTDGVGRPVTVGVLVGSRLREVRTALRDQGLRLEVTRRARCVPGVVLAQRPAPGARLDRGSTVHLVVAQAPAAATCIVPPGAAAARPLRAWALGRESAPRFADRVRLLVANRPVVTLTAPQASDRSRWILDVTYAERSDVRILDALAAGPMQARDVPPFFCPAKGQALPRDLVRRLPWSGTLVTSDGDDGARACLQVAAVQVWAEAGGDITEVNVLMGSP
jgi:hypothetical protein